MSRSKVTAALMRLKEMDKKYSTKWNDGKQVQSNISTESSLEVSPRNHQFKHKPLSDKEKSKNGQTSPTTLSKKRIKTKSPPKSKMGIKIQLNHTKEDESSASDSVTSKKSSGVSPKIRSISSTGNNRSIETGEESDVSKTKESIKSVSSSETVSKVKIKAPILESVDLPRNNDESSVATMLSKCSDASGTVSDPIKSVNESPSRKSNAPETTSTDKNETTIEEVIRVSEGRSEIISELYNAMDKDVSLRNVPSGEEQRTQYEDDTFEEASSTIGSSSSTEEKLNMTSERDTTVSGVKQIKITPHKQAEVVQKEVTIDEDRDKEIVELVAPKIMQSTSECDIGLDEELSNYVKTTENIDEAVPISLLKLSKQITLSKKHVKKSRRHRKLSNENTEEYTDSSMVLKQATLTTEEKENDIEADIAKEKLSTISRKSVKSEQKDLGEASLSSEQNKEEYTDKIEEAKLETEVKDCNPITIVSEDKLLKETPKKSDVTSTLRKLNKDAINAIVRKHRVDTPRKDYKSRHCENCGTVVKLPLADVSKNSDKDDSDASSSEKGKMPKDSNNVQRIKVKKCKNKKASRSSKSRKASNYSKVEGQHSRFDCRQAYRLRKHSAAFSRQQECEDIRNYLLEMERARLKFGSAEFIPFSQLPIIKPLEFPKIEAFVKPDMEDTKLKGNKEIFELQEKIAMIRQWLKDQYILYRNYSNLAQTMNSKYIPTSLEEAKKTILQLQRTTIKNR